MKTREAPFLYTTDCELVLVVGGTWTVSRLSLISRSISQREVAGLVPRYVSITETLPLSQEALTVKNTIVKAMSELGQHLLSLLTGFYEERPTPLHCRLVIQANGLGSYTLLNQVAVVGLLSDQETLRAYQDEFMAFGEYLKSIWE